MRGLMSNYNTVVVTGIGLVCPLGDSSRMVHSGLCQGRSALARIEQTNGATRAGFLAGTLGPNAIDRHLSGRNLNPLDRSARLLSAAAQLALDESRWPSADPRRGGLGLYAGTIYSSMRTISEFDLRAQSEGPSYASPLDFANTVINAPAGQTAIWHGLRGINRTIATGGSSSLDAIGLAMEAIRNGRSPGLLAGGFEELSRGTWDALAGQGVISSGSEPPAPFASSANTMALSEGAALLVLEPRESAMSRGVPILAEVCGYGRAFDSSRRGDEQQSIHTVAQAMKAALAEARKEPEQIEVVCASAGGTATLDRHESLALDRVFGHCEALPVITVLKALLGDSLGAAGALHCAVMVESMRGGIIPAVYDWSRCSANAYELEKNVARPSRGARTCLVNVLSFEGHASSLVLAI
jgi:3-oxoacyl-[acyl-carrier-protein] synthase II